MRLSNSLIWVGAGATGGWLSGSIIFSIGGLLGRSGSTGTEYLGYWSPAFLILSIFYAVPVGIICMVAARLIFYKVSISFLFSNCWKLLSITVLFGSLGALSANPFIILIFTVVSFFMAFTWLVLRR